MLYLNPPYFVINGVSVFPDDTDPLQFYYLPMMPHLTMVTDATTGKPAPQEEMLQVVMLALQERANRAAVARK